MNNGDNHINGSKPPVVGRAKQYKRRPKHRFWKNSQGVVIRITNAGSDMNLFEYKEYGQLKGAYVIGVNVQKDWYKINEDEFNETHPKT